VCLLHHVFRRVVIDTSTLCEANQHLRPFLQQSHKVIERAAIASAEQPAKPSIGNF
jgi:hypothetical protein